MTLVALIMQLSVQLRNNHLWIKVKIAVMIVIVTTIGRGNRAMLVLLDLYRQLLIQLIMIIFFVFLRNM